MVTGDLTQRIARSGRALWRVPRWICHFAVLLAVWQGPVPWCHAHGAALDSMAAAGSAAAGSPAAESPVDELAVHLCLFHPGLGSSDEDLGWHFHFRMPGSGGEQSSESSSTRTVLLRLKAELAEAGGERLESSALAWSVIAAGDIRDLVAQATRMERQSRQHSIRDFTSRLGLLQRYCSYLI